MIIEFKKKKYGVEVTLPCLNANFRSSIVRMPQWLNVDSQRTRKQCFDYIASFTIEHIKNASLCNDQC